MTQLWRIIFCLLIKSTFVWTVCSASKNCCKSLLKGIQRGVGGLGLHLRSWIFLTRFTAISKQTLWQSLNSCEKCELLSDTCVPVMPVIKRCDSITSLPVCHALGLNMSRALAAGKCSHDKVKMSRLISDYSAFFSLLFGTFLHLCSSCWSILWSVLCTHFAGVSAGSGSLAVWGWGFALAFMAALSRLKMIFECVIYFFKFHFFITCDRKLQPSWPTQKFCFTRKMSCEPAVLNDFDLNPFKTKLLRPWRFSLRSLWRALTHRLRSTTIAGVQSCQEVKFPAVMFPLRDS